MVADNIANLDEGRPGKTASIDAVSQSKAAEMLNVSRESVQRAHKVKSTGTPELQNAVTSGQSSVSAAAEVAKLPEEEQREVVAEGASGRPKPQPALRRPPPRQCLEQPTR